MPAGAAAGARPIAVPAANRPPVLTLPLATVSGKDAVACGTATRKPICDWRLETISPVPVVMFVTVTEYRCAERTKAASRS